MDEKTTTIKERILYVSDYKGIGKENFLESINQSYSNYKGKSKLSIPGADVLVEIMSIYPDINLEWLLTGNGNILKNNNGESTQVFKLKTDRVEENQEVPLYELEATAGLSSLFETGKAARVLDSIKIPNLPKCDGAISVTGDSMYPLLKSGDIVLFRQAAVDDIFFGEMYIVSVKNEWEEYLTIKYVQRSDKGDEWIKLVSQNQHHQSRDIHLSKVTALALVKASIRINTMM